jgi:hypothetical protein
VLQEVKSSLRVASYIVQGAQLVACKYVRYSKTSRTVTRIWTSSPYRFQIESKFLT